MKRFFLVAILLVSLFAAKEGKAQLTVGFSFNIGNQPAWGPVGYDYAQYYYLPDIDVYYNVQSSQYIYFESGRWSYSEYLPSRARHYDVYHGHKVVINEPKPYLNNSIYKLKYANYKGDQHQPMIRDSREMKYYESKGHPDHQQWEKQHQKEQKHQEKYDNGNGHGDDKKNHNNS
jgi:hypothetical protein